MESRDWISDVCSSDRAGLAETVAAIVAEADAEAAADLAAFYHYCFCAAGLAAIRVAETTAHATQSAKT